MGPSVIKSAVAQLQTIEQALNGAFFERADAIRAVLVALLAGEHVVLLGPPGTAKSELARSVSQCVVDAAGTGLSFFEYLATRFLTPDDLFGPVDLVAYETGEYRRILAGRMADSDLIFFDECFKASGASLNLLLTLLNERVFHNGRTRVTAPLITMIGASNELPDGDESAALWDRYLLRITIGYLKTDWMAMMQRSSGAAAMPTVSRADVLALQGVVDQVTVPPAMFQALAIFKAALAAEGIESSDRRWRKSLNILRAHALMDGRTVVNEDDLDMLRHVMWNAANEISKVAKIVGKIGNPKVAHYLDLVDAAMLVFQNLKDALVRVQDPGEQGKLVIAAYGKMRTTRDQLNTLDADVTGRKVTTARTQFNTAFREITDQVM